MSNIKVEETEKVVSIENVENIEETEKVVKEKPYQFKELEFDHIFPMMALIDKIGLDKVMSLMDNKSIMNLLQGNKPKDKDEQLKEIGKAVFAVLQVIISRFKECKNELYAVLSSASNLSVEEVSKLPLKHVSSMIVDFIKKDDFKDFFKETLESMKM